MPKNKDGNYRASIVTGRTDDGKEIRFTVVAKTKKETGEKLADTRRIRLLDARK